MAVVAGLAAAVLAYVVINQQRQGTTNNPTTNVAVVPKKVVVYYASKEIAMRSLITPDMITTEEIEPDKVPTGACKSINEIVNKTAKIPIKAAAVITSDLVDDPTLLGLTGRIQYPYRAMTVALDSQSSVAGFIKPNDRVDIIGTFTVGNQSVSRTILQNIVLLATGKQYLPPAAAMAPKNDGSLINNGNNNNNNDQSGISSAPVEVPNATVMVTQVEAEKLVLAASQGKLMLTLRPANDNAKIPVPDINSTAVTGKVASANTPPPPPPPPPAYNNTKSITPTLPPTGVMQIQPRQPVAVTVIRGSEIRQVPVGM